MFARLETFNIRAKGSGRGASARCRAPQAGAPRFAGLRALRTHHLPECAPPSTCSTSPLPRYLTGFCEINQTAIHNITYV